MFRIFNVMTTDIQDSLQQALWALEYKKFDYLSETLNECSDKLKERNKLIRIADTSEGGWGTVCEYQVNPLASDTDDESRIFKAEARALRKKKVSRNKPGKIRSSMGVSSSVGSGGGVSNSQWGGSVAVHSGNRMVLQQASRRSPFRGQSGPYFRQGSSFGGACFSCGEFSHFRKDAPTQVELNPTSSVGPSETTKKAECSTQTKELTDLFFQSYAEQIDELPEVLVDKVDLLPELLNSNQRIICAYLLSYAGFLRSEELLHLRLSDIVIDSTHMSLFIESSKTDKYRDGAWVLIARTGTKLCPVVNIEPFLTWTAMRDIEDRYLFCCFSALKDGYKLRNVEKPISYTTLRELFLEALEVQSVRPSAYINK
ncbi:uncharacterized protein LOC121377920 [Gigantopelta aegis]|uniref:uncharacterized protein LOC121377920 n=1 Tax=Gigantopelta aegis TaxID=1735272 RepID=UPI001B887C01|nr:uncharacterized protein LOC121377920 [Gigantopelta aegis]